MNNSFPKISIITPSFNHGRYIEDAVLSVRDQGYPNFEHIIMDNCSSDGTAEILKKYSHLTVISEPDKGQSDALNKGFNKASGDLIGWLNADEFYMPGAFARLVSHVQEKSNCDLYFGNVIFTGPEANFLRLKSSHSFDRKTLLYYGCFIPTVSTFFRKRIFSDGYRIDSSYECCMDFEYFNRLAADGKTFSYIPHPLGVFRWDGQNKSLNVEQSSSESKRIRNKFSPLKNSKLIKLVRWTFRLKHRMKKLKNKGYIFELKSRRFIGKDFRWFRGTRQKISCLEIEISHDPTQRKSGLEKKLTERLG
jgi:glycosyltransferase involved in cell wall biosynthesis